MTCARDLLLARTQRPIRRPGIGRFAMEALAAFGYHRASTRWGSHAQDCRNASLDRGLFRAQRGQRRRHEQTQAFLRARLCVRRPRLRRRRILLAGLQRSDVHNPNVPRRTLGYPAGYVHARLRLPAVLLSKPPNRSTTSSRGYRRAEHPTPRCAGAKGRARPGHRAAQAGGVWTHIVGLNGGAILSDGAEDAHQQP